MRENDYYELYGYEVTTPTRTERIRSLELELAMLGRTNPTTSEMSVRERRLRPIYDLLDCSNNKRVVQEVDRLLKKQPNFTCAKVLKALAFLRMNKSQECMAIISPITDSVPTEDNTLQALSICYRELEKPEMVCRIYINACKVDKSEELLTHCFMAFVRVGDFQNQYQTAMTLYKMYKKGPYFSWAIMSLLAKGVHTSDFDPSSSLVSLPLAERMMGKFIEENKTHSEQENALFKLILRKQRNYDKLLEMLENTVKPTISTITGVYHEMKLECLQETQQVDILAQYLENTILGNPNEWQYYAEYINLTCSIGEFRVERFLMKVLDLYRSQIPPKSTLVAFLYLYDNLASRNSSPSDELLAPIELYLKYYGHKSSCFLDISPFLRSLPSGDFKRSMLNFSLSEVVQSVCVTELRRQVNYLHLARFHVTANESDGYKDLEYCQELVNRYLYVKSKIGEAQLAECSAHAELITVAALTLVDSFWTDGSASWVGLYRTLRGKSTDAFSPSSEDSDNCEIVGTSNGLTSPTKSSCQILEDDFPILLCLAILVYGLDNSPSSAQIRLLLSKIYIRCGAIGAAQNILRKLDLKYIQFESVGYLYIWKLSQLGFLQDGFRTLTSVENFYTSYQKESMEHLLAAYKYGAWSRILEFNEFRKTLLSSVQFFLVRVEKLLLEYCKDACSHNQTIQIGQKGLYNVSIPTRNGYTDGRDLYAMINYKSNPHINKWKDITMRADQCKLKIRSLLLVLLNDAVQIMWDDSFVHNGVQTMMDIAKHLQEMTTMDFKEFELDEELTANIMWPPRLSKYMASGYIGVIANCLILICTVIQDPANKTLPETVGKILTFFNVKIAEDITTFELKKRSLFQNSEFIEKLFDVVETLGFVCILMDVLSCVINKGENLKEKTKKKKGKGVPVDPLHAQYFNSLQSCLKNCYDRLNSQVNRSIASLKTEYSSCWENVSTFWQDKVDEGLLHILPSSLPIVLTSIHESYSNSLEEISCNIKSKMKYLNSLCIQDLV